MFDIQLKDKHVHLKHGEVIRHKTKVSGNELEKYGSIMVV